MTINSLQVNQIPPTLTTAATAATAPSNPTESAISAASHKTPTTRRLVDRFTCLHLRSCMPCLYTAPAPPTPPGWPVDDGSAATRQPAGPAAPAASTPRTPSLLARLDAHIVALLHAEEATWSVVRADLESEAAEFATEAGKVAKAVAETMGPMVHVALHVVLVFGQRLIAVVASEGVAGQLVLPNNSAAIVEDLVRILAGLVQAGLSSGHATAPVSQATLNRADALAGQLGILHDQLSAPPSVPRALGPTTAATTRA